MHSSTSSSSGGCTVRWYAAAMQLGHVSVWRALAFRMASKGMADDRFDFFQVPHHEAGGPGRGGVGGVHFFSGTPVPHKGGWLKRTTKGDQAFGVSHFFPKLSVFRSPARSLTTVVGQMENPTKH